MFSVWFSMETYSISQCMHYACLFPLLSCLVTLKTLQTGSHRVFKIRILPFRTRQWSSTIINYFILYSSSVNFFRHGVMSERIGSLREGHKKSIGWWGEEEEGWGCRCCWLANFNFLSQFLLKYIYIDRVPYFH